MEMEKEIAKNNGLQKVPCVDGDPRSGITKREYFAGLAMQGLLAGNALCHSDVHNYAVRFADKLLIELEKTK